MPDILSCREKERLANPLEIKKKTEEERHKVTTGFSVFLKINQLDDLKQLLGML